MNKKQRSVVRDLIFSAIGIAILGAGIALMIKPKIGLAPWDIASFTISEALNIKFGSASMVLNFVAITLQILILRSNFKKSQILQIPVSIFLGLIINFFEYSVFTFMVSTYLQKLSVFIIGVLVASFGVSILVVVNFITMPAEGLSLAVAEKTKQSFGKMRFGLDLVCTIGSSAIALILSLPLAVKEGTLIGMVLFNIALNIYIKILKNFIKTDEEAV